jgi:antitoxin ParD1/3/4
MNVSLTKELEEFVEKEVESGLYQTASEVVRAGLRKLKEEKPKAPWTPRTLEELETELLSRIEAMDRGEGVTLEESRRSLERRIKALKK